MYHKLFRFQSIFTTVDLSTMGSNGTRGLCEENERSTRSSHENARRRRRGKRNITHSEELEFSNDIF